VFKVAEEKDEDSLSFKDIDGKIRVKGSSQSLPKSHIVKI